MTRNNEVFLPAFFADVVDEGAVFPYGTLPLHITLFPPVSDTYSGTYSDAIRDVVHPLAAFDVTTGDTALFGPRHNNRVRLIESSLALRSLHSAISSVLVRTSHDPTYRQPYNPHITVQDFEQMPKHRTIRIGGLSIITGTIDGWRVEEKVRLKGSDEATA